MQLIRFVFLCAGSIVLVVASASYAADAPEGATAAATPEATANPAPEATATTPEVAANPAAEAAANPPAGAAADPSTTTNAAKPASQKTILAPATASNPPTVTSPERIYLIRENPFFGLHLEKAVEHAREAEIAGNLGQSAELMEHAHMALTRAREAQRAGNVPGLNEGIASLREALRLPILAAQIPTGPSSQGTRRLDLQCREELERQCGQIQPGDGRIKSCFEEKINDFSPICQQQLKDENAGAASAMAVTRHEKETTATPPEASALRSATDLVREARKNLSQAGGTKYVEIPSQGGVVAVSTEK